jgi:poly-gamma-glutamate synthesis protein (capsule biosynthesis protein)
VRVGSVRVRPLVLAAAGDVNFGNGVLPLLHSYGYGYPWSSVGPLLRTADVATVNLECTLSERGSPVPGKPFTFRAPPAALSAAARLAGLDVVSLANNHSLDFGREAFADTRRAAHTAGIATAGGGASLRDARRPAVLVRGGLRIAFLAYSDIEPPSFFARAGTPGTAPADPRHVAVDVRKAARRADLVVVWFHWGIERQTTPTARQAQLADAALSAGADVVLGAHPHVLQPVERRGRRLVAWSLGNFVFVPHSPGTERSGVLVVQLDANGVRSARLRPALAGPRPALLAE